MQKSIGIYIGSNQDLEILSKLCNFFYSTYNANINIFTDIDINAYLNIANLPTFYMMFCPYSLVFINIADFLQYQYNVVAQEIYVLTSLDDLQKNYIEKNNLSNITLLTLKEEKIYVI